MIENYKDLSDIQINNLLYFLDRSDTHRLNLLNKQFAVDKARKKEDYRQNVINSLSLGQLKLSDFFNWLSYVELEVNNNIFVYEAEEDLLSTKEEIEHLEQKLNRKIKNIYNIDSNHKSIEIINYEAFDNELIITVTVPAQIQVRNDITRQYELKNHIYLSYFVVDLNTNSIILMMHPTKEVASVNGIEKKRDLEAVSLSLLHYFKDNIFNFELKDPDWIHDALADISEEYFHHNNPIIEEQKNKFSNDLLDDLCKILNKFDPLLKKDDIQLRLRRGFEGIYEKELIELHKRVEKELSFTIFL
ncbi:hypothetical protein, partial [Terribacillus saccharophilus]|uniref:hypothetical protein n=1 Tax=Terribacillus saccharophilus TaxID=361277 RepID=UPI002DCDE0D3|nr:hypothetical protein [Terribacillus saccharophilus]